MNELTNNLILEVASKNKAEAKRNDADFRELMRIAHWDYMINRFGINLKLRAMNLLKKSYPDCFDEEGYITETADYEFDLDYDLSWISIRVLRRKIDRDPKLQLNYDWGDLPKLVADPQLRLFD